MRRRIIAALLLVAWTPGVALAHKGPPFPLLLDQRVGPYVVEVWADPDIGTGTFFVVLRAPEGEPFTPTTSIRVGVRPVSGRLPEAIYDASPQRVRRGARYVAEVEFDRGEFFDVRFIIEGPEGGGELASRVEATPDGSIGPIGIAVYSFPFILVAALWWRAAVMRRRLTEEALAAIEDSPSTSEETTSGG
jgi:hypothetical protein